MNVCIKCGTEKPWGEFPKHKAMTSGRLNTCKPCAYAYTKAYKKRHRARITEQEREHRREHPHMHQARLAKYKAKPENRKKAYCHTAVWRALKSGRLVKSPCTCGAKNVEAHHHDYTKPLEVQWMCRPCHINHHLGDRK